MTSHDCGLEARNAAETCCYIFDLLLEAPHFTPGTKDEVAKWVVSERMSCLTLKNSRSQAHAVLNNGAFGVCKTTIESTQST
jgi:hypothetical protein